MSRKFLMSLIGVASFALLAVGGCSKSDDVSTSVTNPNPNPFKPVGTIQGVVRDAVTLQPIINALVSVDLKKYTTDAQGSYFLKDVPATTQIVGGSTEISGSYTLEIDLTNAYTRKEDGTIDVDMRVKTSTPRYPVVSYRSASVRFTSLDDTECSESADAFDDDLDDLSDDGGGATFEFNCATASNHDTPVDGLVTNFNPAIGKLACNISGYVYGCPLTAEFATAQSGYEVKLLSDTFSGNSASGATGNVLGQVTTDANGHFEFLNIECGGMSYELVAADDFTNPRFDTAETGPYTFTGPLGDFETMVFDLEHGSVSNPPKSGALHVCHNDDLGPTIIAISPEPGSDLAANSAETVTITFHEPVHQDPQTGTSPSGVDNLFDRIIVNFDGSKAGNVPYTLAWLPTGCAVTETCTQLRATFETGTSSLYHVTIQNIDDSGFLTDWAGNTAVMGVCPDDSDAPSDWSISTSGSSNDCTIWFSTTGGLTPVAPSVSLTNAASLDEGGQQIGFYDWNITTGAKDYDMFCRKVQVWKDGTEQVGPYVSGGAAVSVSGSSASVDFDIFEGGEGGDSIAFVENSEIALHFDCYVVGISSDDVVGPPSNVVRAEDVVGPILQEDGSDLDCAAGGTGEDPNDSGTLCALTAGEGGDGNSATIDQVVLEFNEELEEEWAETTSNYAFSGLASVTPPTFSSAVYSAPDDAVTLTLATPLLATEVNATRITSGADGVSNTTAVGGDTAVFPIGSGAPGGAGGGTLPYASGGPCVLDRGPVTPPAGTDTATTNNDIREIVTGGDGTCETTALAAEGDIQLQPVSINGRPSGTCVIITAGYATVASGDDVLLGGTDGGGVGEDYVHVGPNGICQTTLAGGDTGSQPIPLGRGIPNATSIRGGPNGLIDTETLNDGTGLPLPLPAADDVLEGGRITVTGVTDINGNVIRTVGDEYYSDGSVR